MANEACVSLESSNKIELSSNQERPTLIREKPICVNLSKREAEDDRFYQTTERLYPWSSVAASSSSFHLLQLFLEDCSSHWYSENQVNSIFMQIGKSSWTCTRFAERPVDPCSSLPSPNEWTSQENCKFFLVFLNIFVLHIPACNHE